MRMIAALQQEHVSLVMQQRNINIDFRVLFGDTFIVPFLGAALIKLTAKCAARGGEIWLQKK